MTALVAVINKNAVALAADSAITSTKIHNSANKLFTLSKFEPIGIMVYGAAEFMGIPWETVIKMYRTQLGESSFPYLKDYAQDFLNYIRTAELLVPASKQKVVLNNIFMATLQQLRTNILEEVKNRNKADPAGLEVTAVPELVVQVIKRDLDALAAYNRLTTITDQEESAFIKDNADAIKSLASQVFEELPIAQAMDSLVLYCCYRFTRDFWWTHSGLVFAGFGLSDVLPVVRAYRVECVFGGHLRGRWDEGLSTDMNSGVGAAIFPYAQFDVVHRFVKGIDGAYRDQYSAHLKTLLTETYPETILQAASITDDEQRRNAKAELINIGRNAIQEFNASWSQFETNTFIQPVLNVISELPIQEIANIAESLVSLTSLQRKISSVSETVGGPVDVAVISKGDGFVWIKRKHYFSKEFNPTFFGNYFRVRRHRGKQKR
jgi:hypothetical protein